jgi:microcystin-dependent protein
MGSLVLFAGNWTPEHWASILSTTYGGDGRTSAGDG